MSEYIAVEQLKSALTRIDIGIWSDIADIVDSLPAADVAPVTHGQWIWVGEKTVEGYTFDRYKCSNCGSVFLEYRSEDHHLRIASMILTGTVRTPCCPDCGTKMSEAVQV